VTRVYETSGHKFVVLLRGTPSMTDTTAWTVEAVTENGDRVKVPGTDNITSSSEGQAYTRACEAIDRWLATAKG
jgi:hypothetical protein